MMYSGHNKRTYACLAKTNEVNIMEKAPKYFIDVLGLLKVTSQKFHQTLVMITHNNEIDQLADRIIRIEDGKIAQ